MYGRVKHSPSVIALAVTAVLSGPSLAQEITTEQTTTIEEVVTKGTPIQDSQKAAIMTKRDANNSVDIISADTIGRFPDQNLADSLGRLPGLAIERDQGQARYINFRGAPFRYTVLAIDGVTIPGAENGRVPRFDAFPSVITQRIEANKAVNAAMPGDAVSGYINLHTFDPLSVEGFSISGDVGWGKQELGDGNIHKSLLRLSWANHNWGFNLFGSDSSRAQVTDNRELDIQLVDSESAIQVNALDFRSYKVERSDSSYGGKLAYQSDSGATQVFLSHLYSEFADDEQRNQYVFELADGAAAANKTPPIGSVTQNNLAIVNRLLQSGTYVNSTQTTTLGLDTLVGAWDLSARYNVTDTDSEAFLPIPYSVGGVAMIDVDVSDLEDPRIALYDTAGNPLSSIAAIDNYAQTLGLIIDQQLKIEADSFKVDATRDITMASLRGSLALGAKYDDRTSQGYGMTQNITAFPSELNINDYVSNTPWQSDFNHGIGGYDFNNNSLRDDWAALGGFDNLTPAADQAIEINEQITALYVMTTTYFDNQRGNLVLGARYEKTDYDSMGPESSYADSFSHWLPSVHFNYDLTDALKLRLSATTSISRPTYNEWRGSASINMTDQQVSGGNPSLEAEEAWGLDASLEYYVGDASLMSVGLFNREIDNVIYADTSVIDGGIYLPSAAGQQWQYTGFINGEDGHLRGLEANMMLNATDFNAPQWLEGFGLNINATLLDSEFTNQAGATFSLPGTSDSIYNASVFYEDFDWSVRLNYQYRDDWLSTTESDAMAEYWAAQERVDLSFSYNLPGSLVGFNNDVSIYANVNNLTDAVDVRYIGDERTPNQVERYGRRWLVGLRFTF
ncbi:TonB-dependent receptor [Pseudidiomarina sediminum]|uniref:TonB-dependent receptor n=1 Tax=Pseudidiomarina sediminum TaxID=431675 RepID=UPI001C94782F|nr:TonB-dependent receptor [Pseudidiomarina sediminum]MBY6063698.1 TonB-dependent receptor [Pseudidiomarina sediminum]